MTPFIVTVLNFLILIASCNAAPNSLKPQFFNASIGPYAICTNSDSNIESVISECYLRCHKPPQPSKTVNIKLYQMNEKSTGPLVIECQKYSLTQSFSQFWTFSTEATAMTKTQLEPNIDECKLNIQKTCPNKNCNTKLPENLSPDYYYARTTRKTENYITLKTMPSSITVSKEEVMIMPLSSDKSFPYHQESGVSKYTIYLWDKPSKLSECPFEESQSYGCDYFTPDDEESHYSCGGQGFSITPDYNLSAVIPHCVVQSMSKEGLIYSEHPDNGLQQKSQRLALTALQYEHIDTESLRNKINHIMSQVDAGLCETQCNLADLEVRSTPTKPTLLRIEQNVILLEPNHNGKKCFIAHGCRLTKPTQFCGNPTKLGLTCSSGSGYWNPMLPYMNLNEQCEHPALNSTLQISAGNHIYHVEDDLTIMVPRGFLHGRSLDSFSIAHTSGLNFNSVSLQSLRAEWVEAKTKQPGPSARVEQSQNISNIEGQHWISGIFHTSVAFVQDKLHALSSLLITVTIFLIGTYVVVKVSMKFILLRLGKPNHRNPTPSIEMEESPRRPLTTDSSIGSDNNRAKWL